MKINKKMGNVSYNKNDSELSPLPPFIYVARLTAATAVTTVAKASAEQENDYQNDYPRRTVTTATVITATHSETSFPVSKVYYDRKNNL